MDLKRRKIRGEVNTAWTCELTWFLDQVAGLDEKLHYIVKNTLFLEGEDEPTTYFIRVPGGTVGSILMNDSERISDIFIDRNYVVESYPEDVNKRVRKFFGERLVMN